MKKSALLLVLVLLAFPLFAQQDELPGDLRQHSLTQFNASLVNPAYLLDFNQPNALSIWSRWQWQSIDGTPTTTFVNYTHALSGNLALSGGFLQNNTGFFLDTGGNLGGAYAFDFNETSSLVLGLNLNAFQRELADDRIVPNQDVINPFDQSTNDFILLVNPGIVFRYQQVRLGLSLEKALFNNFSSDEDFGEETQFTGTLSNDFELNLSEGLGNSFLRPLVYLRSIPDRDTQIGLNALFSTERFWTQGGYNSYYGFSGGAGITLFKSLSLGALAEFGTQSPASDENTTLEILVSYHFGNPHKTEKEENEQEEVEQEEVTPDEDEEKAQAEEQARQAERLAQEREAAEKRRLAAQRERDSLNLVAERAKELAIAQRKKDSLQRLQTEDVKINPNEKYQEVKGEEGLEPGFYLIANVFGTKKYFEAFMADLQKKGLQPGSFYRAKNKYNYVYLQRFNTIQEARKARDSRFFGKYSEKLWIFRVRKAP
ncbi:MAG: PorP/SprF family type IX secretion system membrane protein [Bacteroidota bacterium]